MPSGERNANRKVKVPLEVNGNGSIRQSWYRRRPAVCGGLRVTKAERLFASA